MKPVKFKEANCTYAENQPEYLPLPAFKTNSTQGEVISCWKLSFRERIRILLFGKLWLCIWTFHSALQPIYMTVSKTDVFTRKAIPNKKKKWNAPQLFVKKINNDSFVGPHQGDMNSEYFK